MKRKLWTRVLIALTAVLSLLMGVCGMYYGDENEQQIYCFSSEVGEVFSFSAVETDELVRGCIGANAVVVSSLPEENSGTLRLGTLKIKEGDELGLSLLPLLEFVPSCSDETELVFGFQPVCGSDGLSGVERCVCINLIKKANYAPIAENLTLNTYENIPISGYFAADDPENDAVSYSIAKVPEKGRVTADGNGGFTYTPLPNKRGYDSFTYTATDKRGNRSAEATVTINVMTRKSAVMYADMDGNTALYAALRLDEADIFTGSEIGGSYFFEPSRAVTRSEFVAMCMKIAGEESPTDSSTDFADDDSIETWAKPYIASAQRLGYISGIRQDDGSFIFDGSREISFEEAAVVVDNILKISDVAGSRLETDCVAAWAYQAAANLSSCDVVSPVLTSSAPVSMTRADAAELLCGALELIDERRLKQGSFSFFGS